MKKIIILLILILGISLVAYAGATKYTLMEHNGTGSETGWVIVNINPQKTILEFQVDGLTAGEKYRAFYWDYALPYSGIIEIGELKVNKFGSGHLNVHLSEGISEPCQIGVWVSEDDISNSNVVLYVELPLP
jgi:hypothetical protein